MSLGAPRLQTPPPPANAAQSPTLASRRAVNPYADAFRRFSVSPAVLGFDPKRAGRPTLVSQSGGR